MSASGNYGPIRVAEAIIGHADLTLGARVRDVLEEQMKVGGGRFRGIRYGVSWDPHPEIQNFVSRYVPPGINRDPNFRAGFSQLAKLGLSFESWQYHPQLPDAIDLVGRLTLPEVAACMARCAIFIGNDSGLMHIAAAAGCPTLGLFGPTPANEYGPAGRCAAPVVSADRTMAGLSVDAAFGAAVGLLPPSLRGP